MALRGRGSGSESSSSESSGERETDDTLCEGFKRFDEAYTSVPNGNFHYLVSRSTAKDVAMARGQESPTIKLGEVQSATLQNERQRPAQQQPHAVTFFKHPIQETLSFHVKPSGSLQNGRQETIYQERPSSSKPTATEPYKELAHTHAKAEEKRQQGLELVGSQAENLDSPKRVQTRSDSLNGSAIQPAATRSLSSFRRRKPQPWPNPQQSLGEMIETDKKKMKRKVWVAEGPALELFETRILPQIEQSLHNIEPPQCGPLLLRIYMIGKAEINASPIIMICCCDRKVRKEAESTIRESEILQQFPQMGLGSSAFPLEANSPAVPVAGSSTASQLDAQVPPRFKIHGLQSPVIGRWLRLWIADSRETVRFVTGGPFVRIGDHIYQLTATHISQDMDADAEIHFGLDDECEYDGQSDTDTNIDEEEEVADEDDNNHIRVGTGTQENQQGTCNTPLETGVMSRITDSNKKDLPERFHRPDLGSAQDTTGVDQTLRGFSKVDYFLVKLPAEEAEKASNTIENVGRYGNTLQVTDISALPNPGTEVVVVTLYSHLTGIVLPGKTRVKMRGFDGFQNLIAVRLSSPIKTGDSGSAVLDASTGCLCGHIALGSSPDTIAYMVPSIDTFEEIYAAFGEVPTLKLQPERHIVQHALDLNLIDRRTYDEGIVTRSHDRHSGYTGYITECVPSDSVPSYGGGSVSGWSQTPSQSTAASSAPSAHSNRTDVNNTIQRQRPPNERYQLPCEFQNLTGCDRVFTDDDTQGWMDHIEVHLQSQFPTRLRCCK